MAERASRRCIPSGLREGGEGGENGDEEKEARKKNLRRHKDICGIGPACSKLGEATGQSYDSMEETGWL